MIRKIARHFGRDVQLAVVTRGINTIPNFESLIVEYTQIRPRNNKEFQYAAKAEGESRRERGDDRPRREWGEKVTARAQYNRNAGGQPVNTISFVNKGASTSTADEPKRQHQEEKKKSRGTVREIANLPDDDTTNNVHILLPDLRNYLLYDDEEEITQRVLKCPEVIVKFNNDITVLALIDTGCLINGISESWYNQNKKGIEPYEILPMTNTLVISAVGNKSKLIKKQILCDIELDGVKSECVFVVIPDLIKPCILGMSFLQ